MCLCTQYKLPALQVRLSEEIKLNATTQKFITAKISGCALKQGSETPKQEALVKHTHPYVRAIYNCKMWLC